MSFITHTLRHLHTRELSRNDFRERSTISIRISKTHPDLFHLSATALQLFLITRHKTLSGKTPRQKTGSIFVLLHAKQHDSTTDEVTRRFGKPGLSDLGRNFFKKATLCLLSARFRVSELRHGIRVLVLLTVRRHG